MLDSVNEALPGLTAWTSWCYGENSLLLYDHECQIASACGTQQGDPLGPLYFCLLLKDLTDKIQSLHPRYNKWYMDDGGIVGPADLLVQVWNILVAEGPSRGLFLNPSKCEFTWLNPSISSPCPLPDVPLTSLKDLSMLGAPLGDDTSCNKYIHKKLTKIAPIMNKLIELEDSQSAMFLLRLSLGTGRAMHFMRTTPLPSWLPAARSFDVETRRVVSEVLGAPLPDSAYAQAKLTPSLGGLGLRAVEDHAQAAFTASWNTSALTSGEVWSAHPFVLTTAPVDAKQHHLSLEVDKAIQQRLVAEASKRDRQRLLRLAQPHASAWVTATPDHPDRIISPAHFRLITKRWLGIPLLVSEVRVSCPFCKQSICQHGDHAACCKSKGDIITRHNRMRDVVDLICKDGLLNPQKEKAGILGDNSKRRPGDVTIPIWHNGRSLAIDLAVICPVAPHHLKEAAPCEHYAQTAKHDKYDQGFENTDYDFCPVVFETFGAVNEEGEHFLKKLFRVASNQQNIAHSVYAGKAWARLSCVLQRSIATMIMRRTQPEDGSF